MLFHMRQGKPTLSRREGIFPVIVGKAKRPLPYPEAAQRAARSAAADSDGYRRRQPFEAQGTIVGDLTGQD